MPTSAKLTARMTMPSRSAAAAAAAVRDDTGMAGQNSSEPALECWDFSNDTLSSGIGSSDRVPATADSAFPSSQWVFHRGRGGGTSTGPTWVDVNAGTGNSSQMARDPLRKFPSQQPTSKPYSILQEADPFADNPGVSFAVDARLEFPASPSFHNYKGKSRQHDLLSPSASILCHGSLSRSASVSIVVNASDPLLKDPRDSRDQNMTTDKPSPADSSDIVGHDEAFEHFVRAFQTPASDLTCDVAHSSRAASLDDISTLLSCADVNPHVQMMTTGTLSAEESLKGRSPTFANVRQEGGTDASNDGCQSQTSARPESVNGEEQAEQKTAVEEQDIQRGLGILEKNSHTSVEDMTLLTNSNDVADKEIGLLDPSISGPSLPPSISREDPSNKEVDQLEIENLGSQNRQTDEERPGGGTVWRERECTDASFVDKPSSDKTRSSSDMGRKPTVEEAADGPCDEAAADDPCEEFQRQLQRLKRGEVKGKCEDQAPPRRRSSKRSGGSVIKLDIVCETEKSEPDECGEEDCKSPVSEAERLYNQVKFALQRIANLHKQNAYLKEEIEEWDQAMKADCLRDMSFVRMKTIHRSALAGKPPRDVLAPETVASMSYRTVLNMSAVADVEEAIQKRKEAKAIVQNQLESLQRSREVRESRQPVLEEAYEYYYDAHVIGRKEIKEMEKEFDQFEAKLMDLVKMLQGFPCKWLEKKELLYVLEVLKEFLRSGAPLDETTLPMLEILNPLLEDVELLNMLYKRIDFSEIPQRDQPWSPYERGLSSKGPRRLIARKDMEIPHVLPTLNKEWHKASLQAAFRITDGLALIGELVRKIKELRISDGKRRFKETFKTSPLIGHGM